MRLNILRVNQRTDQFPNEAEESSSKRGKNPNKVSKDEMEDR